MAEGYVLFPDSGRFIPAAAQSRSDKSWSEREVVSQDVADALRANAFITDRPRSAVGGFNRIVAVWALTVIDRHRIRTERRMVLIGDFFSKLEYIFDCADRFYPDYWRL